MTAVPTGPFGEANRRNWSVLLSRHLGIANKVIGSMRPTILAIPNKGDRRIGGLRQPSPGSEREPE
jgi:hypothetical protein